MDFCNNFLDVIVYFCGQTSFKKHIWCKLRFSRPSQVFQYPYEVPSLSSPFHRYVNSYVSAYDVTRNSCAVTADATTNSCAVTADVTTNSCAVTADVTTNSCAAPATSLSGAACLDYSVASENICHDIPRHPSTDWTSLMDHSRGIDSLVFPSSLQTNPIHDVSTTGQRQAFI